MATEHCVLLALPVGQTAQSIIQSSQTLHTAFIQYLQVPTFLSTFLLLHDHKAVHSNFFSEFYLNFFRIWADRSFYIL